MKEGQADGAESVGGEHSGLKVSHGQTKLMLATAKTISTQACRGPTPQIQQGHLDAATRIVRVKNAIDTNRPKELMPRRRTPIYLPALG